MHKILFVTSSVRESRIADKILETAKQQLAASGDYDVTIADFKTMPLPFFDAPVSPSNEQFQPTDEHVLAWTEMVKKADAVIMLIAEYNYSFTAVLKNAIDWIYAEWADKPVALIGYGWVGGARAIAQLRGVLGSTINAKTLETEANLRFTKEIGLDGTVIDPQATEASIATVLAELKTVLH